MKIFKKVSALHKAVELQDGSNQMYLLLLIAIASIVKIFTGDKADAKIDELIQKITAVWGLIDIFAQVENHYNSLTDASDTEHPA